MILRKVGCVNHLGISENHQKVTYGRDSSFNNMVSSLHVVEIPQVMTASRNVSCDLKSLCSVSKIGVCEYADLA